MTDRPQMFAPTRGFSGMADSMEPYKMFWGDPCCHGNKIWAKIGYNSTCMAHRLQMFAPTRGFLGYGRFNGTMQNVVGPTLVAMATKFGLNRL